MQFATIAIAEESTDAPEEIVGTGEVLDTAEDRTGYADNQIDDDPWPLARAAVDMPRIQDIKVRCHKSSMDVKVEFDRPFDGMIFSKGHYANHNCVHLRPRSHARYAEFSISQHACGMVASQNYNRGYGNTGGGIFIENTIIFQFDPELQEEWDSARRLRCTWYDFYEKAVTFRPFNVDMLDAITTNFLGDNIQCWMQIQVGKGPYSNEVSSIVKIGQTMTMVLGIKDDEGSFDMHVHSCVAHDGRRQPIQLVDERGCVVKQKLMSPFKKIRNFGASASVVSFAYFKAFKFPDSMNVHFQCVIQVCKKGCPSARCGYGHEGGHEGGHVDPRDPTGYSDDQSHNYPQQQHPNQVGPQGGPVYEHGDQSSENQYIPAPSNHQQQVEPRNPTTFEQSANYQVAGGTPRNAKVKRQVNLSQSKDITTNRVIQVVAPNDVAFDLGSTNQTIVDVYATRSRYEFQDNHLCMSVPGFAAGLVFLLLVLIISCILSVFLFMRIRSLNGKSSGVSSMDRSALSGYENPEFVKIPA